MIHPEPQAVRDVADRLESMAKQLKKTKFPPILDMECGRVLQAKDYGVEGNQCGTVACHAGHYLLATKDREPNVDFLCDVFGEHVLYDSNTEGEVFYIIGSFRMARDLGFGRVRDLVNWARENPDVWGNDYGGTMFNSDGYEAFGLPHVGSCLDESDAKVMEAGLDVIIQHWRDVADRIEDLA